MQRLLAESGRSSWPDAFCKKYCSLKFRRIHRKTRVLQSFFNKVTGLDSSTGALLCIFRNTCFVEYLQTASAVNEGSGGVVPFGDKFNTEPPSDGHVKITNYNYTFLHY